MSDARTQTSDGRKPRLVFFQYRYDPRLPPFLLQHADEHVRCLAQSFEVTVIRDDCDYLEVCDRHQPDLVLVESGVNHPTCRRPRVLNVRRHPEVPKLGLHHADAFCNARTGFISDMEHWGIETFFAITTTAGHHSPEIARHMLYWPVFIDSSIFRDYGLPKTIPVLLTGNSSALYPWRRAAFPRLASSLPTLVCPHPGYDPDHTFAHVLFGERYARTLNASWCVPTCGTVVGEAVRKHFEVPASGACLIAERTPALEAAGFENMVNCVFAEPAEVLDKVDWLLRNPDDLQRIIQAGGQLVRERHTMQARTQIRAWYELRKRLQPGEWIVQSNPFALPVAVDSSQSAAQTLHVRSDGAHLRHLREGDRNLLAGDFASAERSYSACADLMAWMPEAKLRLALCSLHQGQPARAQELLDQITGFVLRTYGAADPDPVEWGVRVVNLLCFGAVEQAIQQARRFPHLTHPWLARARRLCDRIEDGRPVCPVDEELFAPWRASIHVLPPQRFDEWLADIERMLIACRQQELAQRLMSGRQTQVRFSAVRSMWGGVRARAVSAKTRLQELRRGVFASRSRALLRDWLQRLGVAARRKGGGPPAEAYSAMSRWIAPHTPWLVASVGEVGGAARAAFLAACRACTNSAATACVDVNALDDRAVHRLSKFLQSHRRGLLDALLVDASHFAAAHPQAIEVLQALARNSTYVLIADSDSKTGFLLQTALLCGGEYRLEGTDRSGRPLAWLRRLPTAVEPSTHAHVAAVRGKAATANSSVLHATYSGAP